MAVPLPPGGRAWDACFALQASDGITLRAAVWNRDGPRGHMIFCTGRTEFLEKVSIPAAEFASRGFAVASIDWRGQGLSDRLTDAPLKGHVQDFLDYHLDLAALLAAPEVQELPGPRLLVGHSMGGAIALGALMRGRIAPKALILVAPMLDIRMSRRMRRAAMITMALARLVHRLDRWPPFGEMETPYVFSGFKDNVLTSDRAVFEWMVEALRAEPRLQLAMPTLGWMAEATAECKAIRRGGRLEIPSLCLLGTDEMVVDADAARSGALRLGATLIEIDGARHELLIERADLRAKAWTAIDSFLEAHFQARP